MNDNIILLAAEIRNRYQILNPTTAYTVAISGIDAAGKGYKSILLKKALEEKGLRVALINLDPWQNCIGKRLKNHDATINFYNNVYRWEIFFDLLLLPLQKNRSINIETVGIKTHADIYYPLKYQFDNIDIILVEGIFLFKKKYLPYYNFRIWVDCSFETGLNRAVLRNAENLDEKALIHAYNTYYYPAQRYHFKEDHPKQNVDHIISNN